MSAIFSKSDVNRSIFSKSEATASADQGEGNWRRSMFLPVDEIGKKASRNSAII